MSKEDPVVFGEPGYSAAPWRDELLLLPYAGGEHIWEWEEDGKTIRDTYIDPTGWGSWMAIRRIKGEKGPDRGWKPVRRSS